MRLAPLRREPLRRASLHALPRPRRRLLSLSLSPPQTGLFTRAAVNRRVVQLAGVALLAAHHGQLASQIRHARAGVNSAPPARHLRHFPSLSAADVRAAGYDSVHGIRDAFEGCGEEEGLGGEPEPQSEGGEPEPQSESDTQTEEFVVYDQNQVIPR